MNEAQIFGFAGKIGSGKTTAAMLMHEQLEGPTLHLEFSDSVTSVANSILIRLVESTNSTKDIVRNALEEDFALSIPLHILDNLDFGTLDNLLDHGEYLHNFSNIDVTTKDTYRPILQWLGHELSTKYDPDFWSKPVESLIRSKKQDVDLITVGGVRYDGNAKMIHKVGGVVVQIYRNSLSAFSEHDSEKGISEELIDIRVDNNSSVEDLASNMKDILR